MEVARDEPARSPFDKLPLQVVEHIFLKGCEMEMPKSKYSIYVGSVNRFRGGPVSRRLKPFAITVRGVCSRWKNMIDSEETFSLSRYWFARLVLAIPSYSISRRTDQGEKREYVSFAKQMLQFRSQLTSSRGCDLDISLYSSEKMAKWDDSMDLYSETGIMLRLMAYALVDLQRYSKQIVAIIVDSDEPHMVLNTIILLLMIPRRDSRLSRLEFKQDSGLEVPETSLKKELNAVWRHSEDPPHSSTLLDFSHLTNIDTLYGSWLAGNVQLPIGTITIHMWNESRSMSWLKVFTRRHPHTFANLTYLHIHEDRTSSERDPEVTKWLSHSGVSGQLIFPSLCTLALEVADVNGADFIRHSSFPKLETAVLNLQASEEMTTQNDDTSPIPAISLPFLVRFYIYIPYSWASLAALNGLISHPTQVEEIYIYDEYNFGQQVSTEFVDSLRYTLSMLRPVRLGLRSDNSSSFRFLLEALNLNSLQKLDIKRYGWQDKKSPLQDHINKNSVTPAIDAPNLTYLSFEEMHVETSIHILTRLSTLTNLQDLKADGILVKSEDIIIVSHTSSEQKLSHGEDDIYMSLDLPNQLFREDFGMDVEGRLITLLYESLGPNSAGRVKFPKLTGSHFLLYFDASMYTQRDILVLGLKRCLRSILRSRSKCGATRLVLQEAVQVQVQDPHKDGDRPFKCEIRLQKKGLKYKGLDGGP